jgi:hypothetical protein
MVVGVIQKGLLYVPNKEANTKKDLNITNPNTIIE